MAYLLIINGIDTLLNIPRPTNLNRRTSSLSPNYIFFNNFCLQYGFH